MKYVRQPDSSCVSKGLIVGLFGWLRDYDRWHDNILVDEQVVRLQLINGAVEARVKDTPPPHNSNSMTFEKTFTQFASPSARPG